MKPKFSPRIIGRIYQKAFFLEQWRLLYHFSEELSTSFAEFNALVPPRDRFWADPHVVHVDGRYYVFVEEYCFGAGKGHIAVLEMDEQGNCGDSVQVLTQPYHLSYPFVFEWEGGYFMVPESVANRTIELYECVEFPHRWRFRMNLMEGVRAVDTTLLNHAGKWWLFAGIAEHAISLPFARLFLYFADCPLTRAWHSHPHNPLVPNADTGRPAGGVWVNGDRLLRPSQDCSRTYGYGFDLNQILHLSTTDYAEKKVMSVRPDWDTKVLATHSFARANCLTVIDAFTRTPRLALPWQP